jgi:hypothetical protein
MRIAFKEKSIQRKSNTNGLLLSKTTNPCFEAQYFENGEVINSKSTILSKINLSRIAFENDLTIDDLGDAYLNDELFEGTSLVEKNGILLELACFQGDEITKNIRFNLNEELVFFNEQNVRPGIDLELEFEGGVISSINYSNNSGEVILARLHEGSITMLSLSSSVLVEEVKVLEEIVSDLFPDFIIRDLSISENLHLRKHASDLDLLNTFEISKLNTLTLDKTLLNLEEAKGLISRLAPSKVNLYEEAIKESDLIEFQNFLDSKSTEYLN